MEEIPKTTEKFKDLTKSENKDYREKEIERRSEAIHAAGFSKDFLEKLKKRYSTLPAEHFLDEKIADLKRVGFLNPITLLEKRPDILEYSFEENIKPKLAEFEKSGFENPIDLVERLPEILSLSFENNIKPKLAELDKVGFADPVALVQREPEILILSFEENIKPKLAELEKSGFENPIALVEKMPSILGLSFEANIKPKLEDLEKAGFKNPVVMIEKRPQILGLSFEDNIKPKLANLEKLGFRTPAPLVERSPGILAYSFEENIKPKFELVERILRTYGITKYTSVDVFEKFPALFGLKIDRIIMTTRLIQDYVENPKDLELTKIAKLLIQSPENILLVLKNEEKIPVATIISRIREVNKKYKDKEEKRNLILEKYNRNPNNKLLERYFSVYPMKTK